MERLLETVLKNSDERPEMADLSFPVVNLFKAKNDLVDAGVSPNQIYIINLPDSSKFPMMKKLSKINPQIKTLIHTVSSLFNSNLIKIMTEDDAARNLPSSHIFSANELLDEVISHAEEMGFKNVVDSCVEKNEMPVCNGYLFFDDVHPTVASGKLIGLRIAKIIAIKRK
jgi:phospholipase/lecithinase/hemolysin